MWTKRSPDRQLHGYTPAYLQIRGLPAELYCPSGARTEASGCSPCDFSAPACSELSFLSSCPRIFQPHSASVMNDRKLENANNGVKTVLNLLCTSVRKLKLESKRSAQKYHCTVMTNLLHAVIANIKNSVSQVEHIKLTNNMKKTA